MDSVPVKIAVDDVSTWLKITWRELGERFGAALEHAVIGDSVADENFQAPLSVFVGFSLE